MAPACSQKGHRLSVVGDGLILFSNALWGFIVIQNAFQAYFLTRSAFNLLFISSTRKTMF